MPSSLEFGRDQKCIKGRNKKRCHYASQIIFSLCRTARPFPAPIMATMTWGSFEKDLLKGIFLDNQDPSLILQALPQPVTQWVRPDW